MTQPSEDPRKVKVIVELIDHSVKISELNDRADLAERLKTAKERITDPQIRVVIAGQLKQGKSQLVNSLVNLPVARVGDDETHRAGHRRLLRREGVGTVDRVQRPGRRARRHRDLHDDIKKDLRRAPEAGGRQVLRLEVNAPSGIAQERLGARRHAGSRRPRPAASVGHPRSDAGR